MIFTLHNKRHVLQMNLQKTPLILTIIIDSLAKPLRWLESKNLLIHHLCPKELDIT